MFALREALHHFRDVVQGAHIVIGTDHLDNILVSTTGELRQPQKILRWLMEIGGMGRIRWAFTPGAANVFADWASRNPGDRDLIIPTTDEEVDPSLPSNLRDAFIAASAAQGLPLHVVLPVAPTDAPVEHEPTPVTQRRVLTQGANPGGEGAVLAKKVMTEFRAARREAADPPLVTPSFKVSK